MAASFGGITIEEEGVKPTGTFANRPYFSDVTLTAQSILHSVIPELTCTLRLHRIIIKLIINLNYSEQYWLIL